MAMNRKTVAESMRRQGLRARAAKAFRHTTDSGHSLGVAPNVLAQDFSAKRPDEKWAGDITYLRTIQGWLYLAVILDLRTRKVIGWATSTRIDACPAWRAERRDHAYGSRQRLLWLGSSQPAPSLWTDRQHERPR